MASAVPKPPDLMRCVCLHQVYLHPVFVLYMHLKIYVGVLGTSPLAGSFLLSCLLKSERTSATFSPAALTL